MEKLFSTKGGGTIKDVDVRTGTITGYAADFDSLDSDGDVFQKGAFKKSIIENKSRIMHLLQHDTLKPLGRPEVIIEDTKGLYFEMKLNPKQLEVQYIADTMKLYEAGVYKEHSVGFITLKDHKEQKDQRNINVITEVKLMEYSTVTWGANENTPFMGLKGLEKDGILSRMDVVCKALRTNGLSDNVYINLEIELQQIKALISGLLPDPKGTTKNNEGKPSDLVELFLKGIKI